MRLLSLPVLAMLSGMMALAHNPEGRHSGRPIPLPPESRVFYRSPPNQDLTPQATKSNGTRILPLPPKPTPTVPPSPVPTPLDLSISYSLSSSCLLYLTPLLTSAKFTSCLPFSLLLTTSTTYSDLISTSITKSNFTDLNNLLAYISSPQPAATQCDAFMFNALSEIGSKVNCASDLSTKSANAVATEAKTGIGNYKLMREAATITDPDTGVFCYLEALSSTKPDDLYLWSLAAGIPYVFSAPVLSLVLMRPVRVPSNSTPTCSKCSALLLGHYSESQSSTSTINGTIVSEAINVVNSACGRTFVNYNASYSGASTSARFPSIEGLSVMLLIIAVWSLLL